MWRWIVTHQNNLERNCKVKQVFKISKLQDPFTSSPVNCVDEDLFILVILTLPCCYQRVYHFVSCKCIVWLSVRSETVNKNKDVLPLAPLETWGIIGPLWFLLRNYQSIICYSVLALNRSLKVPSWCFYEQTLSIGVLVVSESQSAASLNDIHLK